MRKTAWAVFSIRELKHMLAVAEKISETHGLSHNDSDCAIFAFSAQADGRGMLQLSTESVRPVCSDKSYLPANLLPGVTGEAMLMDYTGEYFTKPIARRRS